MISENNMKIAIVSRSFDGIAGGVEKMVLTLAAELVKKNHKVVVISLDRLAASAFYSWPRDVVWEKLDLGDHLVKSNFITRTRRILRLRRVLVKHQVNTVVGFQIGSFALARISSIGLNIRTIAAERNAPTLYSFIRLGKIKQSFSSFILLFADAITVQFESYRTMYPKILRSRIYHTPNPIIPVRSAINKSGQSMSFFKILYVGRLTFQKNLEVLINAIAISNLKVELTIVGDGDLKESLRLLGYKHKIEIKFYDATKSLSKFYLSSDIFCIPSRWEGFPNVVGEALAHGLPVVAFKNCAGMPELIKDNLNGILASGNDDPISLANALKRASELDWDPQLSILSCENFSLDKFVVKWETALKDVD
jgi:glycosyltransferase involved in cell wall biosynthesis